MKKRKHNSPPPNVGIDNRALQKAAALLVRAISAELAAGRLPAPQREKRRAGDARNQRGAERVVQTTPVPATREEVLRIAARLYVLGGACSWLSLPLKVTTAWMPLADVAAFADQAEEHVRGLLGLFDEYLAAHPDAMERGLPSTRQITGFELQDARKEIGRLAKIAGGEADLDISPEYLPPEFRPEGFGERPYGDEADEPHERGDEGEDDGDET